MKRLITTSALALMLIAPAYAQSSAPADAPKPAAQDMMMNCPMMGDTSAMQKDLGSMMGDVETMMKETRNSAQKEHLQKMHERMAVMMANMQKMGMGGMMGTGMMGAGRMGGQQPGTASPNSSQAAPVTPPVSPEGHATAPPKQ